MFLYRNKAKNETNLHWLEADIHSHLLPGLDDGSPDIETSISYIRRLHTLGLTHFYTTPHVFAELYPNDAKSIHNALAGLRQQPIEGVCLEAAAEYMVDTAFANLLATETLLTLPGKRVLIEMSYVGENKHIKHYIFDLQLKGYQVVLAHPERYLFYHDDPTHYQQFKDLGCLFQMNLLSPTGYYNSAVKKAAHHLLKRGMVDLVGTDLHHERHLAAIEKFVTSGDAYAAFKKNPIKNSAWFGTQ